MKKFLLFFITISVLALTSCERVGPNSQGVLMENFGQNGKTDFKLVKGRISTVAPGTELFQVPLWEQRAKFENVLNIQDAERTEYKCTPNYSYTAIPERSIDLVFTNKQLGAGDDFMQSLENNILEPTMYDIIKDVSRSLNTEQLTSSGGNLEFERKVRKIVDTAFAAKGIKLGAFTVQLIPSDKVRTKIDARSEVNTNLTVISQQIIEQKEKNKLAELRAEELRLMSAGYTPNVLLREFIKKWDGKTPLYGDQIVELFKKVE